MPRVTRKQADLNREAIKVAAARLFREKGFTGVAIPEITGAAGLTHGSFYGHFSSKEQMAAEASAAAFRVGFERWELRRAGQPSAAAARTGFIAGYLTERNRDNPGDACPLAALAGDVARLGLESPVRKTFIDGIQVILEKLASVQAGGDAGTVERQALTDLSAMVGALILSRATKSSALSEKFLHLVTAELTRAAAPEALPPEGEVDG